MSIDAYDSTFIPLERLSSKTKEPSKNDVVELISRWLIYCLLGVDVSEEWPKKIVRPSGIVQYHECPQQKNLIDCGLFTAGVMLRLFEGRDVQINSFSQTDVTKLRNTLAVLGVGKRRYHKLQQIAAIREAFGLDFDNKHTDIKAKEVVVEAETDHVAGGDGELAGGGGKLGGGDGKSSGDGDELAGGGDELAGGDNGGDGDEVAGGGDELAGGDNGGDGDELAGGDGDELAGGGGKLGGGDGKSSGDGDE